MLDSKQQTDAKNPILASVGFQPQDSDPIYQKDGYLWYRSDLGLLRFNIAGALRGIALLGADGKLLVSQVPKIAISDTYVVSSQAAMLALVAETGDLAIRTDLSKTFVLTTNSPSILADWAELLTPPDSVSSVNGQTGTVVLDTSDIAEGANLYYTQARFDSAFAAKSTTDLTEGSNLYYTNARFDTRFATKTTTDLSEGLNLYYTDERVDDRVAALIQNGTGISWTYSDVGNTLTGNLVDGAINIIKLAEFYPTNGGLLNLNVAAGRIRNDNVVTDKSPQVVALINNSTNYVEITSLGVASSNIVGFTAGSVPVALVITLSGVITSITDRRTWLSMGGGGGGSVPSTSGQQYYSDEYVASPSVDWDNGNYQHIQLANGAQAITLTNGKPGARYVIVLKQPAAGAAGTVTWPVSVLWPSSVTPVLTVTNGKVDIISLSYSAVDGKYYGAYGLNY